jgi:uncharacterized protein (TIGR03437 family)
MLTGWMLRIAVLSLLGAGALLHAQLPFDIPVAQVLADPGSANTLYAGTPAGLFKSTDNGTTWNQVIINPLGQPQPPVVSLAIDPTTPGVLFLGTDAAHQYLLRSTDGGASWQAIGAGLAGSQGDSCRVFYRPAFATIYCSKPIEEPRSHNDLWKSADGGATWEVVTRSSRAIDVSWSTPMVMYRPVDRIRMERSDDGGKSWTSAGVPVSPAQARPEDEINSVAVSPDDHDIVIVTSNGPWNPPNPYYGIHRTANGGASWTRPVTTRAAGVVFDPVNPGQAFAFPGIPLSFHWSSDNGVTWTNVDVLEKTQADITTLTMVSRDNGFIVPTSDGVYAGKRNDPTWPRLGTYRPTLSASPSMIETTLLSRTTSEPRFDFKVQALESSDIELSQLSLAPPTADWLTVTQSSSDETAFTARVDAENLSGGNYETTLSFSASGTVNPTFDLSVKLTVADQAARPFVVLDQPLPESRAYRALAADSQGRLVFAGRNQILRAESDGSTTVLAGTGSSGNSGDGGPAVDAEIGFIRHLTYDAAGNLYLAGGLGPIRKIDTSGIIRTVVGMDSGFDDPEDGGDALAFRLFGFGGMAVDPNGALHFSADDRIWQLLDNGTIKLIAGGGQSTGDNVRALVASLEDVEAIAFNPDGELVFTEQDMHRVRIISKAGLVRTLAGSGEEGFDGGGGNPRQAKLSDPEDITFDASGQLYFLDQGGRVIRRLRNNGTIQTVMGNGVTGETGHCVAALMAPASGLNTPLFTPEGWLLVVDGGDAFRIWLGDPAGGAQPSVADGAVVNAASFVPQLSEGGLFSVFGERVAARRDQAPGKWPYVLGDAAVCLDDQPQPLYFTDTGQINGQTSYGVPPGSHWLRVYSLTGSSGAIEVDVAAASPGVFQYGGGHAVATNPDLSVNGPTNPVDGGSFIVAYLTGIGAVDNPVPTGDIALADPLSRPIGEVKVTINGQETSVIFLGLSPGFIGLAQANINIPDLPPGDYDLVITIAGVSSAPVRISIR